MSGDTLDFLQGNRETLTGTLHDPAATPGDVLTVQPDGSIAAAPGGGSQPIGGPLDLPGCILWLDASQIEGLSDGDPVDAWADLSASGYDATATSPAFGNEIQTVDITGAGSGQYELVDPVDGSTMTVPIAWDANAAAVKAAIEALPSIGAGNTIVALAAQVFTIEYVGALANEQVGAFGVNQDTLDVLPVAADTQAGFESRPSWVGNVQNGKPVVRFDPTKNAAATPPRQQLDFTGPGLSALSGLDGLTMIVVAPGIPFRDNQGLLYFSNGAAADHKRLLAGAAETDYFLDDADAVGTIMILADNTTVAFGVFLLMIDNAASGVTTSRSSQCKALVGDWAATAPQPFADTPSIAAHLGFEEYDPLGWPGDIAEIIFYDRALNIGEQREISEYLGAKWALL